MYKTSKTRAISHVVVGMICLVVLSYVLDSVRFAHLDHQAQEKLAKYLGSNVATTGLWSGDKNSLQTRCQVLLSIQVDQQDIFNGLDGRNMLRAFYNDHQLASSLKVRVQFQFPRAPTSLMDSHLVLMEQENGDVFVSTNDGGDETPKFVPQKCDWIATTSTKVAVNLENLVAYLQTAEPGYITLTNQSSSLFSLKHITVMPTSDTGALPDPVQLDADAYSVDCTNPTAFQPRNVLVAYNCEYPKIWNSGALLHPITPISPAAINSLIPKHSSPPQNKKLLLGVFSYLSGDFSTPTTAQRNLVRILYKNLQNASQLEIDVRFVIGIPASQAGMQLLLREQELYKDLIMVLVGENMNEGKSFHYFAQIERMMKEGVIPEYAFVGKCDTDTFINLRGLVGELDKLPTEQQHFVGLDSFTLGADRRIMFGMLYIMSRPLLQRVAQLQLGVEELKLAEDLLMGALVVRLGEDVKWVSLQLFNFECFRHPLTRQDIATHWCKKPEDMWQNQMLLEQLYAPSS